MRTVTLALMLASSLLASVGSAQDAPPSDRVTRDAVQAFDTGSRAAEEERWSDALPAFQRAYALTRSEIALFNVGYVLRALGRFVEAHAAFNEVIARLDGAGELLEQARAYRNEVLGRIAHLRVDGLEPQTRYALLLDGTAREDDGARPLDLSLDPGSHGLSVRREGYMPFDWSGTLGEGETSRLAVELQPIPHGGTVADEAWFWIVVSVVVVGAGVGVGFLVDDAAQLDAAPGRTVVRL
ncbi:MAG: PEGA domain-containing protein [Sandaracinaceae bacterium]|nr:PEGA domain-containing protein [Sandaracinaceae bacterium]